MANKVRFTDQLTVNSFGNVMPEAIVTASGGVGSIVFTKANGSQVVLPLATTQSSADSLVTASVLNNTITFTKGDLSTFSVTVDTGSSGESVNTGSLLTTGSANLNVLTFTKGDGTSFTLTVDTGSGTISAGTVSSSAQITALGFVTSSATASFITNSQTSSMSVLSAQTASYVLNAVSSSHTVFAISASYAVSSSHEIIKEISSSHADIADTASYVETAQTASYVTSSNIVGNFTTSSIINFPTEVSRSAAAAGFGAGTSIDTGSFVQNSQTSSMTVGTASIANFIPFDGNRSVSNQNQPPNIRNVNFGANGLVDFINKVYFTNSAPVLAAQSITIEEFLPSGSTVATISATDAETQSISFGTASTYTDDFFRIDSSTGVITMNVKSTSSMNVYNDGGVLKSPFPVTATDTFNESGSRTYYIRITPNTAPIWSETSGVGNVTDITESIAEDSTAGTNKDRYYFRDTEGDTITIGSGSFSPHFTTAFALTLQSGYVRLDQITASLDYDTYPSYSFVLTASDEHYQSGDDPNSITYLPVRINVTDNIAPSINNQPLTGVNEKSNTGAVAGTVFAEDDEGNTMTFTQFILKSAFLNSNPTVNLTSSLGGASLQNPSSDPFSINPSTGQVTRKAGQFLNVDIADRYVYTTTVRDNFNPVSASADITIPIANHIANTISISNNANIIETATAGDTIKRSSTGLGGNNTILSAANNSIQRWEITSTPDLIEATNITASSTTLRLKSDLSGSSTVGGDTITLRITASQDDFDTTIQYLDKVVDVELMAAPVLTPSDQTSNLNTNGARGSNNLVLVSITDPQSFTIDHSTWTFTPNAGQALEAVQNGGADSYYVRPTSNLAAGTYGYTASIFNDKGFRAGELKDEFTIAQAPIGSLTTNGTFRIIESAVSGANIVTNLDGRTGTQGDLGVNYGAGFNSPSVQSFTSSNAAIAVTDTGLLSMAVNVSGSPSSSGDTFTSDITYRDQFDNIGSGSISVAVRPNSAPSATITPVSPTLEAPQNAGTKLADVSISDTEGDTPFNLSLTGTDAASLVAFPTNANSSSYEIRLAGNENAAASFTYNAVVKDNFGKTQTYSNQTLSIDAVPLLWYAYAPEVGAYVTDVAGAFDSYGDTSDNGTLDTNYPLYNMANGDLGNATLTSSALVTPIDTNAEFSFLVASGSSITASRTTLFLEGLNLTVGQQNATGLIIVFPSGSSNFLQPESMGNSLGDNTSGRYLMYGDTPGVGSDGPRSSGIRYYDFVGSNTYPNGTETRFGAIVLPSAPSTNINYYLMSASGSAPVSQQ